MDATDGSQVISIVALTIFFGAFVLSILVVFSRKKDEHDKSVRGDDKQENEKKTKAKSDDSNKKAAPKERAKSRSKEAAFSHPMLLATLKGHTGSIKQVEFSRCGKYLGSCSEGKMILRDFQRSFEIGKVPANSAVFMSNDVC